MSNRNSNIELLRVTSMLLIVCGHFVQQSGEFNVCECVNDFILIFISSGSRISVNIFLLGRVDIKIKRRFLSRISAQTRRENAGGLSPGKFSQRSMRKIQPKRCVLGLVSTRPNRNMVYG